MSPWQEDVLDLFRQTRARATQASNITLHQACGRAIEAMIAEGGSVPSDLNTYAQDIRRLYGPCAPSLVASMSSGYVG
jgi:hypothetical protein